ncbi:hypothetical protein [Nonomuraea sp. NPDC050202]|uniref:hypothetical protein n=1 Tax=Nonomuraea sp. NPDC050202 TaxID=3155035 RepID=UPI0033FF4979
MLGELFNAAYQDAIGGVEIKRAVRPDGTQEVQTTPPNGKIALELMSRMDPDEWRPVKAVELEVSGPDGGPVRVAGQEGVVEGIRERVRKAKERRRPRRQPAPSWSGRRRGSTVGSHEAGGIRETSPRSVTCGW